MSELEKLIDAVDAAVKLGDMKPLGESSKRDPAMEAIIRQGEAAISCQRDSMLRALDLHSIAAALRRAKEDESLLASVTRQFSHAYLCAYIWHQRKCNCGRDEVLEKLAAYRAAAKDAQ